MASKNIARLGVLLGLDMAQFNADMDKAVFATKRLEQEAARSNERALKDARAIQLATEDYGKTLTKVQQIERAIEEGRYKGASDTAIAQIRSRAAAYDAEVAAMRKVNAEKLKMGGGLTPQQQAQIGYQMTDIFTSLMGGQNPMMVLIQQGGQLRDVFGGAGNALKAIIQTVGVFRLVAGGFAAALGYIAYQAYQGAQQMAQLRDDLILTGNVAGLTQSKIIQVGDALSNDMNVSIGNSRDLLAEMAGAGKFTETSFYAVSRAIALYSKLAGVDGAEAAKALIPLLDGTASSAKQLNDKYNFLTLAQYKQIEALEKQGRLQESMKLQAEALEKTWGDQERNVGTLEKAWSAFAGAISRAREALLAFGRAPGVERVQELGKLILEMQSEIARRLAAGLKTGSQEAALSSFRAELNQILDRMYQETVTAEERAKNNIKNKGDLDKYLKAGGAEGDLSRIQDLAKARIQAERSALEKNMPELTQARVEYQQKVEDLVREMRDRNEKEGGRLTLHNQQVLNYKLIELANQFYQKQKDIKLKQYLDEYEDRKKAEDETLDALVKEINLRSAVSNKVFAEIKATQDDYKTQKALLEFRRNNLLATELQVEQEKIRLDVARQLAELELNPAFFGAENADVKAAVANKIKALGEVRSQMLALNEDTKVYEQLNQVVWSNMSQAIENFVRTGKLSFKDFARSIIQDMLMIQMRAQASRLLGMVGSFFAPKTAALDAGWMDSMVSFTGKADGGPVAGNTPYIVGERGPELFMPSSAGTIVPNHAMSSMGGTTNVTNNYIQAIDVQSFEQRLLGSSNTIWAANQYANKSLAVAGGRA